MADPRERLGKGLRFPVSVNLNGGISMSAHDDNVRQSLFVILGTAPGERMMRPEFGCRIHDLMFAPNHAVTAARAQFYCEEAIYKFEPRVRKIVVSASVNPDEPHRLDVSISYEINGKPDRRNLVFPFYLRTPDEEDAAGAAPSAV